MGAVGAKAVRAQDFFRPVDILKVPFENYNYVLERADMLTRWDASMNDFASLVDSTHTIYVCLFRNGAIRNVRLPVNTHEKGYLEKMFTSAEEDDDFVAKKMDMNDLPDRPLSMREAITAGTEASRKLIALKVPGMNLDESLTLLGGGTKVLMRAFSEDTPSAEPIVRRVSSTQELVGHVLSILATGAESVNLCLGYEMLQLRYDKMDVVNEAENTRRSSNQSLPSNIVSFFSWGPVRYFRIWEARDPQQPYYDRIKDSGRFTKHTKAAIVREMRQNGRPQREIDLFIEKTGGEGAAKVVGEVKTDRLLRLMAKETKRRLFWSQETDESFHPMDGNAPKENRGVKLVPRPPAGVVVTTIDKVVEGLVKGMGVLAGSVNNWQTLIDWEPLYIKTIKESMHEAQRLRMMSDEYGYIQMCTKTLDLMQKMTVQTRLNTAKLSNMDWYAIVMSNKQIADEILEQYLRDEVSRDFFENRLKLQCKRVIHIIDGTLLPMAEHNRDIERTTMCWRQRSDYMRYMYLWISSERKSAEEIVNSYHRGLEYAAQLAPGHNIGIGVYVNLSTFYAECLRDTEKASQVCMAGLEWAAKPTERLPTPGQIFTHALLASNLEAFESMLLFLKVRFHAKDLEMQKEALGENFGVVAGPDESEDEDEYNFAQLPGDVMSEEKATPCIGYDEREAVHKRPDCSDWTGAKLAAAAFAKRLNVDCVDRHNQNLTSSSSHTGSGRAGNKAKHHPAARHDKRTMADVKRALRDARAQLPREQQRNCRVADRWITGMPGFDHDAAARQVDEEEVGENSAGTDGIKTVRWVETVEPINERGDFMAACVVRYNQQLFAKGGKRWIDQVVQQISAWPGMDPNGDHVRIKVIKLDEAPLLSEIGMLLTNEGVAKRPFRIKDSWLIPGDTLHLSGPLAGKSPLEGVQMLRERKFEELPLELRFYKPPQVSKFEVVDSMRYCDHHENFRGFRNKSRNLQVSKDFESLAKVIEDAKHIREKDHERGLLPRRIPGLSARRNPAQAMQRGCL